MILSSWSLFLHSTLWYCGFRCSNTYCLKIMECLGEFRIPLSLETVAQQIEAIS